MENIASSIAQKKSMSFSESEQIAVKIFQLQFYRCIHLALRHQQWP
jgi:hypothetical protein